MNPKIAIFVPLVARSDTMVTESVIARRSVCDFPFSDTTASGGDLRVCFPHPQKDKIKLCTTKRNSLVETLCTPC